MLSITDGGSLARALRSPIDPDLIELINKRLEQLRRNFDGNLEDIVSFRIVEVGDSQREITEALGFSILRNPVDGLVFGEPGFTPGWEWSQCHGRWFELVYILSDDGFGMIVFVPNSAHPAAALAIIAALIILSRLANRARLSPCSNQRARLSGRCSA